MRLTERWAVALLVAFVAAYGVFFSVYQVRRHQVFWTDGDLVSVEQPIWNTLHGRFLRTTYYPIAGERVVDFEARTTESALGDHVQPILLALAVPYALVPRAETLLVLMSVSVGLGAIPLFRIARRRLRSAWWALLFALGYLFLPAVQTNSGWDVHGANFLPPLLLAALDAAESGKRGWWWLWAVLAMSCREDMPFLVGWAMLWMVPPARRREGAAMLGLGLALSLLYFLVVIPYFGGGGTPYLVRFFPLGTEMSLTGIFAAMQRPVFWQSNLTAFIVYNIRLALPLLFLYWLHWPALLAMAPTLLLNGFSWYPHMRLPAAWHYSASIVPWALIGAVDGLIVAERFLARRKAAVNWRGLIAEALLVSILAAHFLEGYTPLRWGFVWPTPVGREASAQSILREIPADAPISSELQLAAHLAGRETLRFFPDTRDAEWLLVDVWLGQYHYLNEAEVWSAVLADPGWETVQARDGLILLKRGQGPPQDVEQAFRPATGAWPKLSVQFGAPGSGLRLLEAAFLPRPGGSFFLCTRWVREGQGVATPRVQVQSAGAEPMAEQPLDGLRFAPLLFNRPGDIQECTHLPRPQGEALVRLAVIGDLGQLYPASLMAPGDWEGQATVEEGELVWRLAAW